MGIGGGVKSYAELLNEWKKFERSARTLYPGITTEEIYNHIYNSVVLILLEREG